MFDLHGMFSFLGAVACLFLGILAVVLKLCGVLLLSWGMVCLPFVAVAVLLLLSSARIG